jgi:hypothetical protein
MDRYQALCECAQIKLTAEDDQKYRSAHISVYVAFARDVVNRGLRPVVFDLDCCLCGGSGYGRSHQAA